MNNMPRSSNVKEKINVHYLYKPTWNQVRDVILKIDDGSPVGVDLETTGLDWKTNDITVIGIKTSKGVCGVDCRDPQIRDYLIKYVTSRGWIAHNAVFDGGFLYKYHDKTKPLNCKGDSMVAFKMLNNEGYAGQNWRLDTLIETCLSWNSSNNKRDLDKMLEKHSLTKAEMSKLLDIEPIKFLKYCADDAEACYQGLHHCRAIIQHKFSHTPMLFSLDKLYGCLINLVVEQQYHGVLVDLPALFEYKEEIDVLIQKKEQEFRSIPEVAELIQKHDAPILQAYYEPKRTVSTVRAKQSDTPWEDSQKEKWTRRFDLPAKAKWEQEKGVYTREVVKISQRKKTKPPKVFKITSTKDLIWLFYGLRYSKCKDTGNKIVTQEHPGLINYTTSFDKNGKLQITVIMKDKPDFPIPLGATKGNSVPTDKKALTFFGEAGRVLKEFNSLVSVQQFNSSLDNVTDHETKIWHPELKVYGTLTGRSSGGSEESVKKGKLSPQILPKDKTFLGMLKARPNHKLIHLDFRSLEDVVLAEASRDPVLMEIYNSGKPHDGYLYRAVEYDPRRDEINAVYNKHNPTKESVGAAKKQFKKIRDVWKVKCISEGTLILTNKGYLPIESITSEMKVHDGVDWVSTNGAIYMGDKDCINLHGVWMTPDHKVLDNKGGWKGAEEFIRTNKEGEYTAQCYRFDKPSYSWSDVWRLASSLLYSYSKKWLQIYKGKM